MKYENLAEIYFNRGDNFMMLNNFELALEDFNKAIELEPFYPYYIFYRAYLYQDNGYNAEAINDYDRVLLYNPEDYVAMTNRGEAYYALGNKNAAFLDFYKSQGI
ncbi:MAG: tetratricopeptide repeat protein [Bacteroidales bacterium]